MGALEELTVQDSTIEALNSVIQVCWHHRVHVSLPDPKPEANTAGLL